MTEFCFLVACEIFLRMTILYLLTRTRLSISAFLCVSLSPASIAHASDPEIWPSSYE